MKTCDKFKKLIILHSLGELKGSEIHILEEHVKVCSSCRTEMEKQRDFVRKMKARAGLEPTSELLTECRNELRARLRHEKRKKLTSSWWESFSEHVTESLKPSGVLVGAIALLILGITLGRYFFPSYNAAFRGFDNEAIQALMALESGKTIPKFESIRPDPVTQEVEIQLTSERTYYLRGSLKDEPIKRLLSYAIKEEENPGLRMRSIKAIAAMPHTDEEIEAALLHALKNDDNSGIRLQAIRLIRDFPINQQIREALIQVLVADSNLGVKKEAVDALSQVQDEKVLEALENVAQQDTSEYIQFKTSKVLERREEKVLHK